MNCHYLIDYENVREFGLQGLPDLPESDTVHIFYSQNASTINLATFLKLAQSGIRASLKLYLVGNGKQSADMQLVSFLGYLIGTEGLKSRYFIISRDSDFQNTPAFWKSRFKEITVMTAVTIQQANEKDREAAARQEPAIRAEKADQTETIQQAAEPEQTEQAEGTENAETGAEAEKKEKKEKKVKPRKETSRDRSRLNNQIQKALSGKNVEEAKISDVASTAVKYFQAEDRKETIQKLLVEKYGKDEGDGLYQWIAPCL